MFSGAVYPEFLNGGIYVIPFDAVACLKKEAFETPVFHLNDVFITGFVADKCGLERLGHSRIHSGIYPYVMHLRKEAKRMTGNLFAS